MQPSVSFISWPKFQNKSFPCTGAFLLKCLWMRGRHVAFLLQRGETFNYLQKSCYSCKNIGLKMITVRDEMQEQPAVIGRIIKHFLPALCSILTAVPRNITPLTSVTEPPSSNVLSHYEME